MTQHTLEGRSDNEVLWFQRRGFLQAAAAWTSMGGFAAAQAQSRSNVVELVGGMNAWKRENKPVEGASNEPQMSMEQYNASIPANKTVLVDFGAQWCPPCVKMNPVLDDLKNDKSLDFVFVKVDAGVQTNLMKEMNIEPIPVFIVYKSGKEVWRKQGIVSKEELQSQLK